LKKRIKLSGGFILLSGELLHGPQISLINADKKEFAANERKIRESIIRVHSRDSRQAFLLEPQENRFS
jgi:hypothetical protein